MDTPFLLGERSIFFVLFREMLSFKYYNPILPLVGVVTIKEPKRSNTPNGV